MSTYASPDSLVETSWLAAHLNDPEIRIVKATKTSFFTVPDTFPTPSTLIGVRT